MAQFFSDEQTTLTASMLNRIVPSDGDFPAAGDLGVGEFLDGVVAGSAELKRSFTTGLMAVSMAAASQHSATFDALSPDAQDAILRDVESSQQEFFSELVRQTYNGYYMNTRVIEALGLEARPPQPKGFPLEIGNLDLIEQVKARGIKYRQV